MTKKQIVPILVLLVATVSLQAVDDMKAYPPAEKGMLRHVLQLPKEENEADLKVELIAGKTVRVDAGNRYFFGGKIEKEFIQGWGYTRYLIRKLGSIAGTLMASDPNVPKADRFVTLGGEPYLIRYNSRLPAVVYAPANVEVRYRVWRAESEAKVIQEG